MKPPFTGGGDMSKAASKILEELIGCGLLVVTVSITLQNTSIPMLSGFDFTRGFAGDIEH